MDRKVSDSSMLGNYFAQLVQTYPKKAEMLNWMKYAIDNKVYYYGQHFLAPYEARPLPIRLKESLISIYFQFKTLKTPYHGAVLSNAYFNVSGYIRQEGYPVALPPWMTGNISHYAKETIYQMMHGDFNQLLTDDFQKRIYKLRDELYYFLKSNETPFVLLANDLVPIHRIIIDVCKDLNIPTGVFLHGLPGPYSAIDDSRADYLFVWGERIRENYIKAGSKTTVIVVGHPNFSSFKIGEHSDDNVVVLTRAICGAPSMSDRHHIHERGLCIQQIYAVEDALKKTGVNHAILRLHPSENPSWYEKFMDRNFYKIDSNKLDYTIGHARMIIGPVSTVSVHAALNDVPYYPFIIDQSTNPYASEVPPPFSNRDSFPTAFSVSDLVNNINNGNCVTKNHFEGYINDVFDVKRITQFIKK